MVNVQCWTSKLHRKTVGLNVDQNNGNSSIKEVQYGYGNNKFNDENE